ncbi:MAG: TRAP transporter substrate-binding protein DctP [Alphaproteobacteria bacterium]|nr:TRAP transporter substrate-binding protein DctP [Alphaproteobacteria bacterium]MDX5369459.1 TRAP transporter substrate-binding protein DctP [Alphaproteobacteria bacterium]MDX5464137.1 TRAP transporter substrate-binding protein DctP [Alphaproteobacteria bacterium]
MKFGKMKTVAALAALLLGAVSGTAFAQQIELKVGDWQSLQHIQSTAGTQWFMKEVEKRTNGKVKFVHFPAEQAAKARGLLDAAASGVVDIALTGSLYSPDRLPLNSVIGLPGLGNSAVAATKPLNEMVRSGLLRDEFIDAGVVPLYAYALTPYQILLRDKAVANVADWDGLKIRTGGTTQALTARSMGATGISLPGPEVYTAVERGTVDGVLFPIPSVAPYNLQEVVKFISTNGSFGNFGCNLVINKATFDALPADVKEVMLEVGTEAALNVAKAQDDLSAGLLKEWAAQGITLIEFTPEQLSAYETALASVSDEWVERIGKNNPKAEAVYEAFLKGVAAQ